MKQFLNKIDIKKVLNITVKIANILGIVFLLLFLLLFNKRIYGLWHIGITLIVMSLGLGCLEYKYSIVDKIIEVYGQQIFYTNGSKEVKNEAIAEYIEKKGYEVLSITPNQIIIKDGKQKIKLKPVTDKNKQLVINYLSRIDFSKLQEEHYEYIVINKLQ